MEAAADSSERCRILDRTLVVLGLLVIVLAGLRTVGTPSFWLHLASGRYIAEHGVPATDPFSLSVPEGTPWINTSWLYDRILYTLFSTTGPGGIVLTHALAVGVAFFLLARIAGSRKAWSAAIPWALWISGWLIAPLLGVGPFLFTLPILALFILLLDCDVISKRRLAAILAVQLLWANLHPSFLLGPLLCIVFAAARYFDGESRSPSAMMKRASIAAACLVVALINPYAARLLPAAFSGLTSPVATIANDWISMLYPYFGTSTGTWSRYAVVALVASAFVTCRHRLPLAYTALGACGAFLAFRSPNFADAAAVLVFPFLCLSLASLGDILAASLPQTALREKAGTYSRIALLALLLTGAATHMSNRYLNRSGSTSSFGIGLSQSLFPSAVVDKLVGQPSFTARTINLMHDGGFLLWSTPGRKVMLDQRAALLGANAYSIVAKALMGDVDSTKILEAGGAPEAVLLNCASPGSTMIVRHLLASRKWILAYFDGLSALFVANPSPWTVLLANKELQQGGLDLLEDERKAYAKAVRSKAYPAPSPRIAGAASFFQDLGRFREAEALYEILVDGSPTMATAWMGLGVCRVQLGRHLEAVEPLEIAARRMPKAPLAWLWLSKAYSLAGNDVAASKARERAATLNGELTEAFFSTNAPAARQPSPL